jgi:hypothetical protein
MSKKNYETIELRVLEKDKPFGDGAAVNVAVVPGVAKAFEVVYLLIKELPVWM